MDDRTSSISDYSAQIPALSNAAEAQRRKSVQKWAYFTLALVLALAFVFPMYFMVTSGFKDEDEVLAVPIHWLPQDFQGLAQYQRAFDYQPIVRFFGNSLLVALADVVVT